MYEKSIKESQFGLDQEIKMSPLEQELYSLSLNFGAINQEKIQIYHAKIKQLYVETYDQIAALANTPELISFATAIQAQINLALITAKARKLCGFPQEVHVDEGIRNLCAEVTAEIEKLIIENELREDVFQVLRIYHEKIYPQEEESLHPEEHRYIETMMNDYKRNGLYIEDRSVKQRIVAINKQITDLCIKFQKNVDEDVTSFILPESDLDGLPKSFFTEEKETAPGMYRVTLKYPDLYPILEYANKKAIRTMILQAYENRCETENLPLLKQIIELRQEKASLLGYQTHADYIAEDRLLGSAQKIKLFLDEMNQRFTPLLEKDLRQLTEFARQKQHDDTLELGISDIRYYIRLHKEEICALNMEEIKKYFPKDQVIQGTLAIYQQLLGLRFVERPNENVWHADIRYFDVYNSDDVAEAAGEKIGGFYLDLYPRDGKFAHAEAVDLISGCDLSPINPKQRQLSLSAMVCNFPKDDNLSFHDVRTFFHEFGHLMHLTCNKTKLACHNGFTTETDFVEAPSQMLENWCFEPVVLNMLSAHVETKATLPEELVTQLKLQDKLYAGYQYKRQLHFGLFDFYVHNLSKEKLQDLDLKTLYNQLHSQILRLSPADTCGVASFTHLVGGYDAGYYGYLLSQTYAMDMYAAFFAKDPLSRATGMRYRERILAPGSTEDGMDLLKGFLGREPSCQAFLEHFGLAKPVGASKNAESGFFKLSKNKEAYTEHPDEMKMDGMTLR